MLPDLQFEFNDPADIDAWKENMTHLILSCLNDHFEDAHSEAAATNDDENFLQLVRAVARLYKAICETGGGNCDKALKKLHRLWTSPSEALRRELTSPRRVVPRKCRDTSYYCPVENADQLVYLLNAIPRLRENGAVPTKEDQLWLLRGGLKRAVVFESDGNSATFIEPLSRTSMKKQLNGVDAVVFFVPLDQLALPPLPPRADGKFQAEDLCYNILLRLPHAHPVWSRSDR